MSASASARGILFTGHMIDAPGRAEERFPPRAERAAAEAIQAAVEALRGEPPAPTVGIAGGASGGDILFHEACLQLGVESRMLLAVAPDEYVRASVAPAGAGWCDRFYRLIDRLGFEKARTMGASDGLLEGPVENVWQRANFWMIEELLRLADKRILLALWDGKGGDGPGGTEHLVQVARKKGIRIAPILSTQSLLSS